MSNLKNPLLSFDARNTIGKAITFVKRRGRHIAEKKPEIIDVKSPAQLSWRHMYQKCAALWHGLSDAEKREWEALGTVRHMTGFAYWQSQCLKPNPGIYLPLQGGTMQGAIQMDGYHIHGLPLPIHVQDAWRLLDFQTYTLPYLYWQGARVYHTAAQAIPHGTGTVLAFNSERWDNDTIHDTAVFNSRLTCKTPGKYLAITHIGWARSATGRRELYLYYNGTTVIAALSDSVVADIEIYQCVSTIYDLALDDFIEVMVYQTSGGPLNVTVLAQYTPIFMMQRIG